MQLFHGSKTGKKPGDILSHFGSMLAAAHRLESIFASQEHRAFHARFNGFVVLDYHGQPVRLESFQETLNSFVSYIKTATILKTSVDIKHPLRLKDCWMDDPIGSGGLEIFQDNNDLSGQQREELREIFHPFVGILYPDVVYTLLSPGQIKDIFAQGKNNHYFQNEFKKRKERSIAIGEDFAMAAAHESVWVDLTLKLRLWAIKNGFDSFVYKNEEEGSVGDESYVSLQKNQVSDGVEVYRFLEDKFRLVVGPNFANFVMDSWEQDRKHTNPAQPKKDMYWGGMIRSPSGGRRGVLCFRSQFMF